MSLYCCSLPLFVLGLLTSNGLMALQVEGVSLDISSLPERLILDGQQHLTSLFLSLYSDQPVETRNARGTQKNQFHDF